jgi:hypothetical protein
VAKKLELEAAFLKRFENDAVKSEKYKTLFADFAKVYAEYGPLSKQYDYYAECLMGVDGFRMCGNFVNVFAELKKKQAGKENKFAEVLKNATPALPFKNFNKSTDIKLCRDMLSTYQTAVGQSVMPAYMDSLFTAHKGDVNALVDFLYSNSAFIDNAKAKIMFSDFEQSAAMYERDPMYQLVYAIYQHYQKGVIPQITYLEKQIAALQKEYMQALKDNVTDKKFYPDANGTLRVSYGKVMDYKGRDGIEFKHFTTLDGLVAKNATGEEDFYVKPRVVELYEKKDFGQYVDKDGSLHTAFIGSNHTTGGNSGSPVLNAKGELIGTNFDRNWEGTMSDIMYNPAFCRNIILDVRFTLWVVDKYAGAGYLLNEMKIIR